MPFAPCEDIQLYYEIHGTGMPLLFVSGLGGGSWSWYNQIPYFERFYRVITFDNRGAGRSSLPPGPYSMKRLAEDALCLLDHLQVERTYVVGLSMGGMIAIELALLAPDHISALALGCTHCGGDLRIPPSAQVVEMLINNAGLTPEQIVEKNLPLFLSKKCREEQPGLTAAYRASQLSVPIQPEHAFHAQLAAIRAHDCCSRISALKAPTLVITGSEDVLVPRENALILAQHIPGAELVEISGAGHALHAECGDLLNSLIYQFFQTHGPEDFFSETER